MLLTIDNVIRVPLDDIEPHWHELSSLVRIPNREREEARKARRYGWTEMPEYLEMWSVEDGMLALPRGFRDPLVTGLEALGETVEWDDRRTTERVAHVWPPFPHYRSFQRPAADRLIEAEEGIVEAPAGSGKSVMGLEVIRKARERRNLVIVNEIGIAKQWFAEAGEFLGWDFGLGIVGAGEWREDRLTIATLQTLYSRIDELDANNWWARWGAVILDECHHQTARTFVEIMNRFPARIRGGLSATPDKTGDFEVAQAVLGDVVHRTTRHQLREEGILVRPTIGVVHTGFSADYWPDHTASKRTDHECMKPGCSLSGKRHHSHRNNYQKVLRQLVEDRSRNGLIAGCIAGCKGHRQIVMSKQTKQLRLIAEELAERWPDAPVVWLVGETSPAEREEAKARVMAEPVVLMTTIADEAFNAPPIDVVHMPFPTANEGSIRQRVGRGERAWPGKEGCLVFDYADLDVGVLANQFKRRRWGVYAEERYRVIHEGHEEVAA